MTAIESMATWALERSVKMMEESLAKQNDAFVANSLQLVKEELKKRNEGLKNAQLN